MSKWFARISWDEVPHLTPEAKADLLKTIPAHQVDARSKGIPVLGAGLVYPISEEEIKVADFPIPRHYRLCWGMDAGWNWTAVVWGAIDPDTGVVYLYSCYKRGHAEPAVHAEAIKARGEWIPGVGDAANISITDGQQLINVYRDVYKLDVILPEKGVEAGIYKVWSMMTTGQLKVFTSLQPWFDEFRFYARADDGKGTIVKKNDHLMDATRYLIVSGLQRAKPFPAPKRPFEEVEEKEQFYSPGVFSDNWMGV